MTRRLLRAVLLGALALLLSPPASPSLAAPALDAFELIAEVNALRAANGLPAYQVNSILMSVAQVQTDWRVSAGVTTHSGPDGSTPRERAIAAGYGGGATVFISENIADGSGLTPAGAVQWWTGDSPHLGTMLGPNYVDVGAGVGESGGVVRYTLMAGYIAGAPGSAPAAPSGGSGAPFLQKATPLEDGSIVHVVKAGQTLWTIAAVYGVDIAALRELNGLAEGALLHAGDKILVQPPPSATPTITPTFTLEPTSTRTPRPSPTLKPTSTSTPTPVPGFFEAASPESRALMGAGALLALIGAVFALWRRDS